jgi:hypothetical protein
MASWKQVTEAAPELAARVRADFEAHKHKTLATLRRDGSPRISGTETIFAGDDLWIGSMWKAVKALDLRRDPRFALHGASQSENWQADVKVAGVAEEVSDPIALEAVREALGGAQPAGPSHMFRLDVRELVLTRLGEPADHLVIESWHEGRGLSRLERR